MFKFSH